MYLVWLALAPPRRVCTYVPNAATRNQEIRVRGRGKRKLKIKIKIKKRPTLSQKHKRGGTKFINAKRLISSGLGVMLLDLKFMGGILPY
ncbi:hypothetical protein L211DRAFT_358820 [Terfezia boudieri ATCC MYA-4762]|uniref:Uncharacterized protein n=1 Tax=Terfezia boudieri ATCC MYA-4762 TaxID=1051890 RepID=A0A3N4LVH7_9PEZI|nr:hypothetical protein L211DRAFT_358820 [Terfezia boudieri ATCC MYA-4762]